MKNSRFARFMITGMWTGYSPFAPGTAGSLAACLAFMLARWLIGPDVLLLGLTIGAIGLIFAVGCVVYGKVAHEAYGKKDPSECTADEWAGQAVTLIGLPVTVAGGWLTAGVAFFAFRAFDILKPPPARQLERLADGWGVLADDLAAGIMANILCQIVLRLIVA